jgi:hypothetical protein
MSLTVLQDCVFFFCFFCFVFLVFFVGLMDMSNMKEDLVVHDIIQVVGNIGASPSMMGLHDVLRIIEQKLITFKRYIEAFEAVMGQALSIAQAPPMVQAHPMK